MSTAELSYVFLRPAHSAETDATLSWAGGLDGWADAEPKPLLLYGRP